MVGHSVLQAKQEQVLIMKCLLIVTRSLQVTTGAKMARTRIKEMIERKKQVLRKTPKTLATKLRMEVNSLVRFVLDLNI